MDPKPLNTTYAKRVTLRPYKYVAILIGPPPVYPIDGAKSIGEYSKLNEILTQTFI